MAFDQDLFLLTTLVKGMDEKLDNLSGEIREMKVEAIHMKELYQSQNKDIDELNHEVQLLKMWKASNESIYGGTKQLISIVISVIAIIVSFFSGKQ